MTKWNDILSYTVPAVAGPPAWRDATKPRVIMSEPPTPVRRRSYRASNPFNRYKPELFEDFEHGRTDGRCIVTPKKTTDAYIRGYENGFVEITLESNEHYVGDDVIRQKNVIDAAYRSVARGDVIRALPIRFPKVQVYLDQWYTMHNTTICKTARVWK